MELPRELIRVPNRKYLDALKNIVSKDAFWNQMA
jgi:hypothetical protein